MKKVFHTMKWLTASIVAICLAKTVLAQDPLKYPDVLPPSPETAAFAKNVNIPVSYYSGTPQIGIPIYSVKSGKLELPVSLSYNASGIRVEEAATWVGLGWSLNAGGMITRTIRGKADETPDWGYMNVNNNRKVKYVDTAHCRCHPPTGQTWAIETDITSSGLDLEPDLYTFSAMGYSGKFYYNQDSSRFIHIPYQNILIEGGPGGFTLTAPDGVKLYFGGIHGTYAYEIVDWGISNSYHDGSIQAPVNTGSSETSWSLTQVVDPSGKTIDLQYVHETGLEFGRAGERYGTTIVEGGIQSRQTFFRQYFRKPFLQKISGEQVDIYFKRSSTGRLDMVDTAGGGRSLDTILIKNKQDQLIKAFYFEYGYFTSTLYSAGIIGISQYAETARKRLYLKSIKEKNGNDSIPPYEFTYNGIELPSRLSTSQDYWGYYNGKSNGTLLMPRIQNIPTSPGVPNYAETNGYLPSHGSYINSGGADRRIDTNYNQARMLTRIKYPTGGTTSYYYESNKASDSYLNIYSGMEPPDMVDRSYTFDLTQVIIPSEPPYSLYYSGTFTVTNPVTKLRITPTLATCTTFVDANCKLSVKIRSLPGSTLITTINTNNWFNLQLAAGEYLVEVDVTGSTDDPPPSFSIVFEWGERPDPENYKVGGLRIRKIVSEDGLGNTLSRSFQYNLDNSAESSGVTAGSPVYKVYEVTPMTFANRPYYVSNSTIPLTTEGQTVRYKHVTEFYDSVQSSFKTAYTFSDFGGSNRFGHVLTGAPLHEKDWQNGMLLHKKSFEKTGTNTYRIIAEEKNFYVVHETLEHLFGLYGPQIIPYNVSTEWHLPDSSWTASYAYPNDQQIVLETGIKHLYNSRFLPSYTRHVNSKGQVVHSKTKYPFDYNNVSGYSINTLLSNHIIAVPIKQEVSVNGKIRSGVITKYDGYGMPLEIYSYENAALADTSSHSMSTVLESNYNLKTAIQYSVAHNPGHLITSGNDITSFIWSTSGSYPIAQVKNADTASIAYTSFEFEGYGRWSVGGAPQSDNAAMTGVKDYSLSNGNITRTGLSAKTYIVSYWKKIADGGSVSVNSVTATTGKTANGWTYYEHKITDPGSGTITVSGSATIDELRLYPEKALMSSFTYKQPTGFASACDPANTITYYEYDALQRLSFIRDENRYILKRICYNYAGQPVSCGYDTSAVWQAISSSCEQSEGSNTGNLVIVEKNLNPSSGTYNQTRNTVVASAGACPVCNITLCSGVDKKCINNVCETGVRVNTGSVRINSTQWTCYYHYVWSDASTSETYDEIVGLGGCPIP